MKNISLSPAYSYIRGWWGRIDELNKWILEHRDLVLSKIDGSNNNYMVYNGAGFDNDKNSGWTGYKKSDLRRDIVLYAPHLRREILPFEFVIDIDADIPEHMIRRAKYIQEALESLEIPYTLGFSGNRGFHFHVCISHETTIPQDLATKLPQDVKTLKDTIFKMVCEKAGLDCVDVGSAGIHSRHAIQEFYSLNYKTKCFKVPTVDINIVKIKYPEHPPLEDYELLQWVPTEEQLQSIADRYNNVPSEDNQMTLTLLKRKRNRVKLKNNNNNGDNLWRKKRIEHYVNALKKYGRLEKDPRIQEIHKGHEGIEHISRVHLVMLLLEEGYSDNEIHEIFKLAEDYNPKKTQYFIDYNRKKINEVVK